MSKFAASIARPKAKSVSSSGIYPRTLRSGALLPDPAAFFDAHKNRITSTFGAHNKFIAPPCPSHCPTFPPASDS